MNNSWYLLFLGETAYDSRSQKYLAVGKNLRNELNIIDHQFSNKRFIFSWITITRLILKNFIHTKPNVVICADIFTTPFGLVAKFLFGSIFIFDAREINAHVHAFQHKPFRKFLFGWLEKKSFRYANHIFTVNESLQSYFLKTYKRKVDIIWNMPITNMRSEVNQNRYWEKNENEFYWIFQGAIQSGRGFEEALQFISQRPIHEKLVIIGDWKLNPDLISNLPKNIMFVGKIPSSELVDVTKEGHAGLVFVENKSLSYQYSLPNKFFEYIFSELPIFSFDLPEITRRINQWACGKITTPKTMYADATEFILEYQNLKANTLTYKSYLLTVNPTEPIEIVLKGYIHG